MAEFLFELFFELFAEGISSIYAGAYIRLVRVFDREKVITAKTERKIEIIATVVTVVLMFAMVIGICILSDGEMYLSTLDKTFKKKLDSKYSVQFSCSVMSDSL